MESEKALDECGCAPSPAERRVLWPAVSRRGALGLGALGVVALGAIGGPLIPAAFAATYPSWDDVQAAKANEAAKAAEVQRIQGLIASLTGEVARTKALAEQAADAFYVAQQEYFDAAKRAESLQAQADAEAAKAVDAANKAGRVAAQLYRNGGDDTSMELFFSSSAASADDLLARLGTMDKLIERNQAVYADAKTARDAAQSLSDQAVVARNERDRLQEVAEQKMVESQQAADAAKAALDEQTLHLGELQAQLAALQDTTAKTIADYQAGVEAARIAEEQRLAAERAEAARLARLPPRAVAAVAAVAAAAEEEAAATAAPSSAADGPGPRPGGRPRAMVRGTCSAATATARADITTASTLRRAAVRGSTRPLPARSSTPATTAATATTSRSTTVAGSAPGTRTSGRAGSSSATGSG